MRIRMQKQRKTDKSLSYFMINTILHCLQVYSSAENRLLNSPLCSSVTKPINILLVRFYCRRPREDAHYFISLTSPLSLLSTAPVYSIPRPLKVFELNSHCPTQTPTQTLGCNPFCRCQCHCRCLCWCRTVCTHHQEQWNGTNLNLTQKLSTKNILF